jgi:hypothetical protein
MITPVLIKHISWGTYLFFAALNACFFPIIYFLYPETAGRTLEEIDLIFAKGHNENMNYVKAAQLLPKMTADEMKTNARRIRANTMDEEAKLEAKLDSGSGESDKDDKSEKSASIR